MLPCLLLAVSRVVTQFPVRPNGVTVNYFSVDGGVLDSPMLVEPSTGSGGYSMVVSRFEVGFNALDCGYGIGLLVGGYNDNTAVAVERVSVLRTLVGKNNSNFCLPMQRYYSTVASYVLPIT